MAKKGEREMKVTWYTTLSGDMQWKDYKGGNSDPLGNIKDAIIGIRGRFGKQPNFIKASSKVLLIFLKHPDVIETTSNFKPPKGYSDSMLFGAILKNLFSIKDIEVDEKMKDRMLIAYKENDEIYPDEKAMYEIRGIL